MDIKDQLTNALMEVDTTKISDLLKNNPGLRKTYGVDPYSMMMGGALANAVADQGLVDGFNLVAKYFAPNPAKMREVTNRAAKSGRRFQSALTWCLDHQGWINGDTREAWLCCAMGKPEICDPGQAMRWNVKTPITKQEWQHDVLALCVITGATSTRLQAGYDAMTTVLDPELMELSLKYMLSFHVDRLNTKRVSRLLAEDSGLHWTVDNIGAQPYLNALDATDDQGNTDAAHQIMQARAAMTQKALDLHTQKNSGLTPRRSL